MTKTKKIIISAIAILLAILLAAGAYIVFGVIGIENKRVFPESAVVEAGKTNGETLIDDTAVYQKMNGFGASACWWSKDVGGWENSKDILSLLFSKENGIGLNIYRYNLGAGTKDDDNLYVQGNRTESFMKADGTYDFTADANAQKALAQAKELAGDDLRVTLFCNSAPVAITKNGKGYGSARKDEDPWECNLDEKNYGAFADYCYDTADYFLKQGYRVTEVSPINEPQYAWSAWYNEDGSYSMNQEGCHYSKQQATDLMNVMVKKFKGSEVDEKGCKVSMFESGAAEGKGTTAAAYIDAIIGKGPKYAFKNKQLRDYFDSVSLHSYWSDEKAKTETANYFAEKYSNYDIVCSEYCQMRNDESTGVFDLISKEENGTNGMTIEYGTAMADVIINDLTIMNAIEWDWWLGCAYGVYTDGLVYINADNHSDVQTSKRLWCLGNFSKFIDEGAERIACTSGVENLKSCAFKNPSGETVIVYSNSSAKDLTTSLKSLNANNIEVYTTSAKCDLEQTYAGEKTDNLTIKGQSVVTVVIK
ncbi:MAG: hypothetical protein K2K01_02955 [Eubacterium sp.]|nr:hypothetical protein [Eubacterium sp.]